MSTHISGDGSVEEAICARIWRKEDGDNVPSGKIVVRLTKGRKISLKRTFVAPNGNKYTLFEATQNFLDNIGIADVPLGAPVINLGDTMVVLMSGSTTTSFKTQADPRILARKHATSSLSEYDLNRSLRTLQIFSLKCTNGTITEEELSQMNDLIRKLKALEK